MGQKNNLKLTIKNTAENLDTFYVSVWPNQWTSIDKYSVTLGPGEIGEFLVVFDPPRSTQKGVFLYTFSATSVTTSKSDSKDFLFNFKREYEIYLSELKTNSQVLNTEETLIIQPVVTNLNEIKYKDVLVTTKIFKNNLLIDKFEDQVRIDPDSTKTITNDLQILNSYGYGEFKILVELKDTLNNVLDDKETTFRVNEKTNFVKSKRVDYNITFIVVSITLTNNGNIPDSEYTITESIPVIMKYFFYPELEPSSETIKDNRVIYEWRISNLDPNQSRVIIYQLRFQNAIMGTLILVFFMFILYHIFFRPTVYKKHITPLSHGKEVTISLHVKNKSPLEIRDTVIRDLVPSVAKVVKRFDTLTPDIKMTTKGTRLTWHIDRIKPYEEVVLTYNIVPLMEILGGFKLPKVHMTYKGKGGIIGKIASRIVPVNKNKN